MIEFWKSALEGNTCATVFQYPDWILRDSGPSPWTWQFQAGFAPLEITRRNGTRTVRLLSADYEDLIAFPGRELELLCDVAKRLRATKGWDVCDFRSLLLEGALLSKIATPEGQLNIPEPLRVALGPLKLILLPHDRYFTVSAPETWSSYEQFIGKKLAYQLRSEGKRRQKTFGADGLRMATAETFDQDFQAFVDLHTKRWTEKGFTGQFSTENSIQGMRSFCRSMLSRGQLRLYSVWMGDRPGGALLSFADEKRIYFYACGFDVEFKARHPVKVLLGRAIKDAIEIGPSEFNFLKGREAYKEDWANGHQQTYRLIIAKRTIPAWIAATALTLQAKRRAKALSNTSS